MNKKKKKFTKTNKCMPKSFFNIYIKKKPFTSPLHLFSLLLKKIHEFMEYQINIVVESTRKEGCDQIKAT